MLAVRATSEATAPGSSEAATIRSFSARDQRRRRCTDMTTSICVLVIVLVLGLLLGLHVSTQPRKAAVTGGVRSSRSVDGNTGAILSTLAESYRSVTAPHIRM